MGFMEFIIELLQTLEYLLHVRRWVHQVGDPKVICSWFLSKTTAWHRHNTCVINHLHAIDEVRILSLFLCFVLELL